MASLVNVAVSVLGAAGILVAGLAPANGEQLPLPVPTVSIAQDVPATGVDLTSKSGRYVISGNALYDRQAKRTLKRFSGVVRSLTDDGRYVTYILDGKGSSITKPIMGNVQRTVKVYDRKTGRTRTATTTSSGRTLRPAWRTTCTADNDLCAEGASIDQAPQLQGGHMSGNGHYVVFCANYARRDRVDLYIKNWRTKKLSVVRGACSFDRDADAGGDIVQPPLISENGSTILLDGPRAYGEVGVGTWGPSRALLNRKRLVEVGGITPTMTHDGQTISVKGPFRSDTYWGEDPLPVTWYGVQSGASTPASPPGLQLDMRNASRRGRYFVQLVYQGQAQPALTITDRTLATTYDLGAALNAAGFLPRYTASPVLSGDGKVVFAPTEQGWVSISWTP